MRGGGDLVYDTIMSNENYKTLFISLINLIHARKIKKKKKKTWFLFLPVFVLAAIATENACIWVGSHSALSAISPLSLSLSISRVHIVIFSFFSNFFSSSFSSSANLNSCFFVVIFVLMFLALHMPAFPAVMCGFIPIWWLHLSVVSAEILIYLNIIIAVQSRMKIKTESESVAEAEASTMPESSAYLVSVSKRWMGMLKPIQS